LPFLAGGVLVQLYRIPKPFTADKLLIAVVFFGGFLAAGMDLPSEWEAVTCTAHEVPAHFCKPESPSLTSVGDLYHRIQCIPIFSVAAFCLLNLWKLPVFAPSPIFSFEKTVDFIINGVEEYLGCG